MATVDSPAEHEVLRFFGEKAFEEWRLFETHFDLATGSALLVLLLPGTAGATICEQALAERLAARNSRLARLHFSAISEIIHLGERLLDLDQDKLGGVWVSFMSPERSDEDWIAACGKMLSLLNLHRNRILKALPVPLIFVGEPWLQRIFREAAPDFWSIRSTVVPLLPHSKSNQSSPEEVSLQSPADVIGTEAASDPDYTLQQAHRLANRKDLALRRTELLMRAAAGFQENFRLELAESCWREALTALADVSEREQRIHANVMRAAVLSNLATVLSDLGRKGEALNKAQEAMRIRELMAKAQPDAFLPDLAGSLNNLANRLADLGRLEEALKKTQEAVRIYEQFAKAQPDAFLPDLAGSLNNLANRLGDLGRLEEALNKAQEAVRIREQLAKARPDAFLPMLAGSLNNLANMLAALGRFEEALNKAQEAVRIREQLAKARPDAFLPMLAASLNNLANILADLGRLEEALNKAQEAVRVYEQLAKARPDAFLPVWATSLSNLANRLAALGRLEEALNKAQEAVRIREQLAKARPDAFLPKLAGSLNNLANRLADLGRLEEALDKSQEAARIYEQLAKARPDTFQGDLATSYNSLGHILQRMERHGEAAAIFAQGIKTITPFFQKRPVAFAQLASNLSRNYLVATQEGKLQADESLLAPLMGAINNLNQKSSGD